MMQSTLYCYLSNNTQEYHEGQATQAIGTNLEWSNYEIHELLQLHKMSESSECTVSMRVAANEYIKNDNEVEGYK